MSIYILKLSASLHIIISTILAALPLLILFTLFNVLLLSLSLLRPHLRSTETRRLEDKGASWSHRCLEYASTSTTAFRHPLHHRTHHLCQGVALPSSIALHLRSKCLGEYLLDAAVAEELFEYFVGVNIVKALSLVWICPEHIVVFSLLVITQTSVCFSYHLESFLRIRCPVLVGMYFQCQFSIRFLNLVFVSRLLNAQNVIEILLCPNLID